MGCRLVAAGTSLGHDYSRFSRTGIRAAIPLAMGCRAESSCPRFLRVTVSLRVHNGDPLLNAMQTGCRSKG